MNDSYWLTIHTRLMRMNTQAIQLTDASGLIRRVFQLEYDTIGDALGIERWEDKYAN